MKNYVEMKEDMILRDYLAFDRTKLALSRTFLSYVRTAIGLFASGAGLIILQDQQLLSIIGYILVALAGVVLLGGSLYCNKVRRQLKDLE